MLQPSSPGFQVSCWAGYRLPGSPVPWVSQRQGGLALAQATCLALAAGWHEQRRHAQHCSLGKRCCYHSYSVCPLAAPQELLSWRMGVAFKHRQGCVWSSQVPSVTDKRIKVLPLAGAYQRISALSSACHGTFPGTEDIGPGGDIRRV